MTNQKAIKLAELLEADASEIKRLNEKIASQEQELALYRAKTAARELVEEMKDRFLIDASDKQATDEAVEQYTKLAMERPDEFNVRVAAVKLASNANGSWSLGSPANRSTGSTEPGKTELDAWISG